MKMQRKGKRLSCLAMVYASGSGAGYTQHAAASIEKKLTKIGELSVSIAQMKNELGDTAEAQIVNTDLSSLLHNSRIQKALVVLVWNIMGLDMI